MTQSIHPHLFCPSANGEGVHSIIQSEEKELCLIIVLSLAALWGCEEKTPTIKATLNPLQTRGEYIFMENCAACHANNGETVILGSSLKGIASRTRAPEPLLDGKQYIEISILDPDFTFVERGIPTRCPRILEKN